MNENNERIIARRLNSELSKFMSNDREEEKTKDLDNVVFEIKKNAKLAIYIMCFLILIILPIASIKPIFEEGNIELILGNLFFIPSGIYLLFGMKYERIVYKNGIFKKKNIFGKTKIYKLDDVIKAKYQMNNGSGRVVLYTKNKKKLEIHSFHTNFDWVLKEIKIRNIEIYNK